MPIATTEDSSRDHTADIMEWQAAESSGSETQKTLKRKAEVDPRSEDDVMSDIQMVDCSEIESTSIVKPDKASPPDTIDGEQSFAFCSTLSLILS